MVFILLEKLYVFALGLIVVSVVLEVNVSKVLLLDLFILDPVDVLPCLTIPPI